jgi:hypothetical protein
MDETSEAVNLIARQTERIVDAIDVVLGEGELDFEQTQLLHSLYRAAQRLSAHARLVQDAFK